MSNAATISNKEQMLILGQIQGQLQAIQLGQQGIAAQVTSMDARLRTVEQKTEGITNLVQDVTSLKTSLKELEQRTRTTESRMYFWAGGFGALGAVAVNLGTIAKSLSIFK